MKRRCLCGSLAELDGRCSTCRLAKDLESEADLREANKIDW